MSHRLVRERLEFIEESMGEEYARKKADEARINLDKNMRLMEVEDESRALEVLRLPDFYKDVLQTIVNNIGSFYGYEKSVARARRAPINIDKHGDIRGFYGTGMTAIEILIEQMEKEIGGKVLEQRLRKALEEKIDERKIELLPDRLRPSEERSKGFLETLFG